MANKPKYDYSRFVIPTEIEHKDGIYVLTDDEYYYIGKAYRGNDNGFRQRYGDYVSNEGRGEIDCAGDEFFQLNKNVKMHWLFWSDKDRIDKCRKIEDFLIKQYRIIHGDKLLNKDVKGSKFVVFEDVKSYFKLEHQVNIPLMLEHGIMKRSSEW